MIAPNTIIGGRYRVLKPLGGGGMKLVYLAEDLRLAARRCALAEMVDSFTNAEAQRQAATGFQREAEMLAQLSNEHIPRIYDYFSEQNRHYLVMEYIDGTTLDKELARAGGKLQEARVIDIAIQVLDTLIYLHNLEPPVIYRDLKPSNVMLMADGQAKLIDFGIARHFQPLSNATMIGTQGYAPPEQYRGKVEPRSDLYALGATMHHCVSGRDPSIEAPFSFPPLRKLGPDVTPTLAALVDKALAYEIGKRVASALEFRQALSEIRSGLGTPAAAAPPTASPPPVAKVVRSQLRLPLGTPASPPHSLSSAEAATVVLGAGEVVCPGCHKRIPADSRFCSYCAADLRRVLGPAEVASDPNADTAELPNLRSETRRDSASRARRYSRNAALRNPFVVLAAIFAIALAVMRLFAGLATLDNDTTPPASGRAASGGSGESEPAHRDPRSLAIRHALDSHGYTNVHFKMDGDTIVLWGSVPTEDDRIMVQTIVFTVGKIFSLEDHINVRDEFAGP